MKIFLNRRNEFKTYAVNSQMGGRERESKRQTERDEEVKKKKKEEEEEEEVQE